MSDEELEGVWLGGRAQVANELRRLDHALHLPPTHGSDDITDEPPQSPPQSRLGRAHAARMARPYGVLGRSGPPPGVPSAEAQLERIADFLRQTSNESPSGVHQASPETGGRVVTREARAESPGEEAGRQAHGMAPGSDAVESKPESRARDGSEGEGASGATAQSE